MLPNSSPSLLNSDFTGMITFPQEAQSIVIPATEPQQEIWLAVQMGNEANLAYHESLSLRLCGSLNVDALRASLQDLVQRHEALRINFSEDGVTLCVAASRSIDIPLIDCSTSEYDHDRATQIKQLIHQEANQYAFDIRHDCLFRAKIIRVSNQEHILILTTHQLVCDKWSLGILLSDLAAFYSAHQTGLSVVLEPPQKFSDYALLQAKLPETQAYADAEQYWLQEFSGQIPMLDLPLDQPRPNHRTYSSAREDWILPPALVNNLQQVATQHGCSFLTLLLAGFEVFLHRLSGQIDLVVGVPFSSQALTGCEQLVGQCASFLPLRSHIDSTQRFVDYLLARNAQVLEATQHKEIGFSSLVRKLSLPYHSNRLPLTPVLFKLNRPLVGTDFAFEGLTAEVSINARDYEPFEMALNVSELNGQTMLKCQYNTDLLTAETIRFRLQEFETLLAGIAADVSQQIARLPILPEAERHQILVEWNNTQVAYPNGQCIHQLFEAQVEKTPQAIALISEEGQLTYQELNARANQLAHYLQSQGVGPDTLVGLCAGQSIHSLVGILAILKAGGAFVPLDPTHPTERLAYILQDTAAPLLLTRSHLVKHLPTHLVNTICLDHLDVLDNYSQDNPSSLVVVDDLAYVIYTSGSTGKPKGVLIEQQAIVNHCWSILDHYQLTPQDRILQFASFSFDASLEQIFPGLLVGATVVLRDEQLWTLEEFSEKILTLDLSVIDLPPAFWQQWVRSVVEQPQTIVNHRLRLVICGSDEMRAETLQLWRQSLLKQVRLLNAYGPTEATITATTCEVSTWLEQGGDQRLVPIGRPLMNRTTYILDSHLNPVPIGVVGELYVGGASLARGYLNRPELTTERFIPNLFEQNSLTATGNSQRRDHLPALPGHDRLYKTGDLVRYLPNGNIAFLGRVDFQVKIRGFRIELGDIETVLLQHPAIREVVVVAREDQPGDKRLVAYFVPSSGQSPSLEELRVLLANKLPKYMVPAAFVPMMQLPLTTTGKIDRRALPTPDFSQSRSTDIIQPRTPTEEKLLDIWQALLKTEVSIQDNFFDMGGHSLMAVQLLAMVEKTFGSKLPLTTIFQANTIERMAAILGQTDWSSPCPSMVIVQSGGDRTPLFGIHVLGRGLEFYHPLTKALHPEQPVYGLSTQLMDEKLAPPNQVKALAAHYIQEMRTIQREGPYLLCGVSFGGVVAYEMAQQLYQQGHRVALLALLDSDPTVETDPRSPKEWFSQNLKLLREKRFDIFTHKAQQKIVGLLEKLKRIYKKYHLYHDLRLGRIIDDNLQDFYYGELNEEAMKSYSPQIYPGRVTLFRCQETPIGDHTDLEAAWKKLASAGVEVHNIPGDHLGMLRVSESAEILGTLLQACIDRAIGGEKT